MKEKTRDCQNCSQQFTIEPEDFQFYEKIKVPTPTQCPSCRLQRRLAWFKGFRLYKRKCDLCGEEKISMYSPGAPYVVYCPECWWSDKWDPLDYGRDYDFSRSFFEQFDEQMHRVPLMGLAISRETSKLSPFTNHCDHSKNCYLIYYSDYDEDCLYGFYLTRDKMLIDCSIVFDSERSFDCYNADKLFNVVGSNHVAESLDSAFLKDCLNCRNCFGSASMRNKSYVWFNDQLTKDEYQKRRSAVDLGSYITYTQMMVRAQESWRTIPPSPYFFDFSTNVSGNYVFQSRNCKDSYQVAGAEDSRFLMLIKAPKVKDSYDYTDWGENAERIYEGITIGDNVTDIRFSQDIHYSHNVEYSKSCFGGAHLFGCISMRSKKHCILNKQYSKNEYEKIRGEIIAQMKKSCEYSEFFPMTLSPHDYNDTFAHLFFPLEKEEAIKKGLTWMESKPSEYQAAMSHEEIPDHIKDAGDEILKESIKCATCSRGYRIVPDELQFLRRHNLPLPRRCPFCRIEDKVRQWVKQMTLIDRTCDRCDKSFRTPYTKKDAPKVYCKDCYFAEVV